MNRPKVLTLLSHYLPGFKAGGPIRSIANLVYHANNDFDFRILTRDRDAGDATSYDGVQSNRWQHVAGAQVRYLRSAADAPLQIVREIARLRPDLIYFNSYFDASWCLAPLALARFGECARTPIIIAPRGQFGEKALTIKAAKKKLYLAAFRSLGLANRLIWQATCDNERDDIHRVIGLRASVFVAPNLADVRPIRTSRAAKQRGELRLVFLSRVSPKKNLAGAIEMLATLSSCVKLDIWGPIEDRAYHELCNQKIVNLPPNVVVRWRGTIEPTRVADMLSQYDALLLPTFGENFGHAIVEALAAGCPVVISDRTPWRNLEARSAGWDLPLDAPHAFRQALDDLCAMDEPAHQRLRDGAIRYAAANLRTAEHVAAHRDMFRWALDRSNSRGKHRQRQAA